MHYIISKLGSTPDIDHVLFAALIYTGFFKNVQNNFDDVVFLYNNTYRTKNPRINRTSASNSSDIMSAIEIGMNLNLENYEFYSFMDFLKDSEIENMSSPEILKLFMSNNIVNMSPEDLANSLKPKLGAVRRPKRIITTQTGFQALPFHIIQDQDDSATSRQHRSSQRHRSSRRHRSSHPPAISQKPITSDNTITELITNKNTKEEDGILISSSINPVSTKTRKNRKKKNKTKTKTKNP